MGKGISKAVGGVAGGVGGVAGSLFGTDIAGDAAMARFRAGQMSPEEMKFFKLRLESVTRDIQRRQETLEQIVPNIQALVGGEEASVLAPLRRQQDVDRTALENRLRKELGAGFRTSTAGQQALAEFERQQELAQVSAQQSSLNQLANVRQSFGGTPGTNLAGQMARERQFQSGLAGLPFQQALTERQLGGQLLLKGGALAAGPIGGFFGDLFKSSPSPSVSQGGGQRGSTPNAG